MKVNVHAPACCVMLHRPCPWIRDSGTAGGKGLDGIISGWMKGGFDDGMDGWKGGAGYSRDSSKEDRLRETIGKKKGQRLSSFFPI